jgi:putative flippase GtrA
VKLSPQALFEHARSPEGRKQLRYAGVSVVFVPVGQITIQLLGRFAFLEKHIVNGLVKNDPNYTKASIASAAILTLPNFFANKYLVWRDTNKDNLKTQVAVFWVAAMLGVTLATLLTYFVERAVKNADTSPTVESIAVFFAQLVGFGIVWVVRFLVLDRWLFKATHHGQEPSSSELNELHSELPV